MNVPDGATQTPAVTIIGLGNVLMGDDALGPFVIRHLLAAYDFDPCVTVLDLGTPGLELSPYIRGQDALIVVDTVRSDGAPGSLKLYRRAELLRHAPPERIGPHDPGLRETLLMLDLHDESPPDVLVVGVIPEQTGYGIGLSEATRAAVPRVLAAILIELDRLGHPARPTAMAHEPDIWWEVPQRST